MALGGALGICFKRRKGANWTDILSDGTTKVRHVVRDGAFCTDITLNATGFSGTEDIDWVNIKSINPL